MTRTDKKILSAAVLSIIACSLWTVLAITNPYNIKIEVRLLGSLVALITVAPIIHWITFTKRTQIPYLGLLGVFLLITHASAAVVAPAGYSGAFRFFLSSDSYIEPLILVLTSFTITCLTVWASKTITVRRPALFASIAHRLNSRIVVLFALPIMILFYYLIVQRGLFKPLAQPMMAVHDFILILSMLISLQRSERSQIKALFWGALLPVDMTINSGIFSGFLADLLRYGLYFGLSYIMVRRKVPVWIILLIPLLFIVLYPVKDSVRDQFVNFRENRSVSLAKVVTFGEATINRLSELDVSNLKAEFDGAFHRLMLVQTTAIVMIDVPDRHQHLKGETYAPLVTKFVPRILWPGKPAADSNTWAREYGYLAPDNFDTAYRLPMHTEMYLNFGWYGVLVVSAVLGILISLAKSFFVNPRSDLVTLASAILVSYPFFWPGATFEILFGGAFVQLVSLIIFLGLFNLLAPRFTARRGTPLSRVGRDHAAY